MSRLKPAAGAGRFNPGLEEILTGPTAHRLGIDGLEDRTQPIGRFTLGLHRAAAQAGTITGREGVTGPGKEFDVLRFRLPGGTGGTAENPGGADAGHEKSFKGRVAAHKRLKKGCRIGHEIGLVAHGKQSSKGDRAVATDFATGNQPGRYGRSNGIFIRPIKRGDPANPTGMVRVRLQSNPKAGKLP